MLLHIDTFLKKSNFFQVCQKTQKMAYGELKKFFLCELQKQFRQLF